MPVIETSIHKASGFSTYCFHTLIKQRQKKIIQKSSQKSSLNFQKSPFIAEKKLKENQDLSQLKQGGSLNGQMLGWKDIKFW
jgi:hypothetical protein